MAKISSNELKWQAEDDARTMARYQEIMADSARRGGRAIKAAKVEAANLQKRATAMATAAGTKKKK